MSPGLQRQHPSLKLKVTFLYDNSDLKQKITHIKLDDDKETEYRDTMDLEHEMDYYTGSNLSHRNSNKSFKENFGRHFRKTFNRFTTQHSYTRNITRKTESTAVWNLKPERWGSALVQEKYQEEKICYKRQQKYDDGDDDDNNNNNNNKFITH